MSEMLITCKECEYLMAEQHSDSVLLFFFSVNGKIAVEKIVEYFLEHGVTSVSHYANTVLIEFDKV